jgi:hypothetical protein
MTTVLYITYKLYVILDRTFYFSACIHGLSKFAQPPNPVFSLRLVFSLLFQLLGIISRRFILIFFIQSIYKAF